MANEQPGVLRMPDQDAQLVINQDAQLIIKIFTPTNENFEYLQEQLDKLCAPAGYRVTLFGEYLIPNPANTSWVKLAYNDDGHPTPPKDLKLAVLVEIDCSQPYRKGTSGALVNACINKLESILNPQAGDPKANLEIVPVYAARYGTHISESPDAQQLQDKETDLERQLQGRLTELESQLQEMRAALQALKPPQ